MSPLSMRSQDFVRLVAPRTKRALGKRFSLHFIVHGVNKPFEWLENTLILLLSVPIRPQSPQYQNTDTGSTNTIGGGPRTESSQRLKSIEASDRDGGAAPSPVITLFSLPPELHLLIFSFIQAPVDVVSFGITNQYFLPFAHKSLDDYFMSSFGQWAGMNIVCIGEKLELNDCPPGLFTAEELESLGRGMSEGTSRDSDNGNWMPEPVNPGFLFKFRYDWQLTGPLPGAKAISLRKKCYKRGLESESGFRFILPQLKCNDHTYLPTEEKWILRNLTTKQIVRYDALPQTPGCMRTPMVDGFGFHNIIMSRICWAKPENHRLKNSVGISRGEWAGHRFDITTLSRHVEETRGLGWTDDSEKLVRETVRIWEDEMGPDWLDLTRKTYQSLRHTRESTYLACHCSLCVNY